MEIEAFYSQSKDAKVFWVWDMGEFLTINDDDDIIRVGQTGPVPVQADAPG